MLRRTLTAVAAVEPFPWQLLVATSRAGVRAARSARRAIERGAPLEHLGKAFGELLASHVVLIIDRFDPGGPPSGDTALHFELADGSAVLGVEVSVDLATAALARLLGRPVHVGRIDGGLDAAMRGALAALIIEAARRAGARVALRTTTEDPTSLRAPPAADCPEHRAGVRAQVTVLLDERPYAVTAWAAARPAADSLLGAVEPSILPNLPVTLGLVGAQGLAVPGDLASLRPGDAWLPGAGWLLEQTNDFPRLSGRLVLASPNGERGVGAQCSPEGRVVLTGETVVLAADAEDGTVEGSGTNMTDSTDTLKRVVLDAPVVVRVELAAITLTAREWAQLKPGDVVETARRLGELAVLRVAGREVARGELVNIDGELGVRIVELVDPGQTP